MLIWGFTRGTFPGMLFPVSENFIRQGEERVGKVGLVACMLLACMTWTGSAFATGQGHGPRAEVARTSRAEYWKQRDTAIYVVSTLNLLRDGHQLVVKELARRLHVASYDVYEDIDSAGLYFIELRKANGATVGSFAYKMGWIKPRSMSHNLDRYGLLPAGSSVVDAFHTDSKHLMAHFDSTLPS